MPSKLVKVSVFVAVSSDTFNGTKEECKRLSRDIGYSHSDGRYPFNVEQIVVGAENTLKSYLHISSNRGEYAHQTGDIQIAPANDDEINLDDDDVEAEYDYSR